MLENSGKELFLGHGKLISVHLISAATPAINPQAQVTAARLTNTFICSRDTHRNLAAGRTFSDNLSSNLPSHSFLPLSRCFKGREEEKKNRKICASLCLCHKIHYASCAFL